jgi:serine protease Do
MPTAAQTPPATDPFHPRQTWGAAPIQPFGATSTLNGQQPQSTTSKLAKMCRPARGGWWLWVTIIIVLMVAAGMVPLLSASKQGGSGNPPPPATSLMDEADEYVTADGGGAMITGLAGPGSSLEAAGLVGGDVIMSLGGKPIRDAGVLKKLIAATRPGQSVPVTYIHDGETKQTTITTTPEGSFRGMDPIRERPNGRAVLDINFDDRDRVRVPNSNLYGVELDGVDRNGPAYLAGLQKGDIIIELDGKPIRTAGDLRYRAGAAPPLGIVNIVIVRAGQQLTIPVKLGSQR